MRRHFWWMAQTGALVLALGVGVLAQAPTQVNFSGLINDYTALSAGSWEVRGEWTLNVKGDSGRADFSAALSMERSDLFVIATNTNTEVASARTPHTHHVSMVDGTVTPIAGGFRVSGAVVVTGNGNPAPFGQNSTLQVDITGGNLVAFSNVKLTFGGDAVAHFGTQPLDGVVRN